MPIMSTNMFPSGRDENSNDSKQPSRESVAIIMQKQKEAAEMLKKHMEEDLTDQDRAALKKASQTFMSHASTGLWLGTAVGCAFVFRGRLKRLQGVPGKGFYPTRVKEIVKSEAAAEGAAGAKPKEDPTTARFRWIARGIGFGMLGSFVGTQIGMVTGANAAQKIMDTEGTGAVTKMKWAVEKVAQDLRALDEIEKKGQGRPGFQGGNGENREVPETEGYYQGETVDDQSNDDSSASRIGSSPQVSSRWDELRKQSATPPSSWDTLREKNARQNLPDDKKLPPRGSLPSPNSEPDTYVETDRDAQRREFERLMEKERGGGDDVKRDSKW